MHTPMQIQDTPIHSSYSHGPSLPPLFLLLSVDLDHYVADMAIANLFVLNDTPISSQPMVPSQMHMAPSHPGYVSTSDASTIRSQHTRFSLPSPALSASYVDSSHGKSTWGLATPTSSPSMTSALTSGLHAPTRLTAPAAGHAEPAKPERRQRRYRCLETGCDRRFTSEYTRAVHMNGVHTAKPRKMLACSMGCGELFGRSHDRLRHEVTQHGKVCLTALPCYMWVPFIFGLGLRVLVSTMRAFLLLGTHVSYPQMPWPSTRQNTMARPRCFGDRRTIASDSLDFYVVGLCV